ncbi:MAG: hypothetical protein J1E34_05170 [Oscillospiraceae bacterium]|nr:hypothetical protein [Oscillospiraceae bacterium]
MIFTLAGIKSVIMALCILLGFGSGSLDVKSEVLITELELTDVDISQGYTAEVPKSSGRIKFNRLSFSYEASAPVRIVFTYKRGLKTFKEELLLSSKENASSMLIDGYLNKKFASRLISIFLEPIVSKEPCSVSISGFTCDLQSVPKQNTLYIENERYRAGIKLNWGGGLSYFADKKNDLYDNLLNCHDTGRLVQQSFYGPIEIEGYENGIYNDNVWNYNPVQGGDQYGNTSKLVALEKTDEQLKVVCRPLDWALDNVPTQTYYTSVYTLTKTGLSAENTAVDFLQSEWIPRVQEIPAFYTISAFGNFVFYNGNAPWTNAPLQVETNLPFWDKQPYFDLNEKNDETWCAWTDETGYGIGLFTPIAKSLLAGRYSYNGSSDAENNATNYVAPLCSFVLNFDEPFTYQFHLTSGTVDEIRNTFKNIR